jgi:hypothetical protein
MVNTLMNLFFGCAHRRTTFPLTPARKSGHSTYVVCLDCGKEFGYNWAEMHIGEPVAVPVATEAALSAAHR